MRFNGLVAAAALSAFVGVPALLVSHQANAATATGTLAVSTTVTNNCSVTDGSLVFSGFTSTAATTGSGNFGVTCTNGASYAIALDAGTGTGASLTTSRILTGGTTTADTLTYNLYTDATYATVWGDGTGSTATVPGTGTGQLQTITVNGEIPAGQYPTAQTYNDTVTITVTY
jgi:spore coat protein U-like protein